jgi:hypothetical protein
MFLPETGSGGGGTADQRRDTAFRAASLVVEASQQAESAALPQQALLPPETGTLPPVYGGIPYHGQCGARWYLLVFN